MTTETRDFCPFCGEGYGESMDHAVWEIYDRWRALEAAERKVEFIVESIENGVATLIRRDQPSIAHHLSVGDTFTVSFPAPIVS